MDLSCVLQTDYNLANLNRGGRILQMRGSKILKNHKSCIARAQWFHDNLCADFSHGQLVVISGCPLWFAASTRTSHEGPCHCGRALKDKSCLLRIWKAPLLKLLQDLCLENVID